MSRSPGRNARSLCLALVALLAVGGACLAGDIRAGAAMQVKPYSVWFQDIDKFEQWQTLKKSGDAKAFAAFQEKTLARATPGSSSTRSPSKSSKSSWRRTGSAWK